VPGIAPPFPDGQYHSPPFFFSLSLRSSPLWLVNFLGCDFAPTNVWSTRISLFFWPLVLGLFSLPLDPTLQGDSSASQSAKLFFWGFGLSSLFFPGGSTSFFFLRCLGRESTPKNPKGSKIFHTRNRVFFSWCGR